MGTIAAFHWKPSGEKGYISYMLLNDQDYEMLQQPIKVSLTKNDNREIDKVLNNFLEDIKKLTNNQDEITVERKTVIRRAPTEARDDSVYIHDELEKIINKNGFKKPARLQYDLKGDALKTFKAKLHELGIIDSEKGLEWKVHLWAVALHVTPGTLNQKINRLEKLF